MSIALDKWVFLDFLEHFATELPVIDYKKNMYFYKTSSKLGISLAFSFSIEEETARIIVKCDEYEIPLADFCFDKIKKITCDEKQLILYKNLNEIDAPENIVIKFEPTFRVNFTLL